MIICPNLKNPDVAREFNELVQATSEQAAYHIWSLNNGNAIDKAPNGASSKLFLNLLDYYGGDRVKAIRAKARAYSKSFLKEFGDWINPENVDDTVPESNPYVDSIKDGKIHKVFPVLTSTRLRMLSRVDKNGEPNSWELAHYKFNLHSKIGFPILDVFKNSDSYKHDISTITKLVEERGDNISSTEAINIYNAILKYVAKHAYIPDVYSEDFNEIIIDVFGKSSFETIRFAEDRREDVQFDLPSDEYDAKIELYNLSKQHPDLTLTDRVIHTPKKELFNKIVEFINIVNTTDLIQGIYGLLNSINDASTQIDNETTFYYNYEYEGDYKELIDLRLSNTSSVLKLLGTDLMEQCK